MENVPFERLKLDVAAASAGQILQLEDVIEGVMSRRVAEIALARRTRQTCLTRICPHCQSNDILLHGKDQNGRQRFKCRGCRRTYNILTGTAMARARKPEKWGRYLECMTEHMPLQQVVASGIGVHLVTAWRWRHRFLQAAANDNAAILSGLVEADTTFFRRSCKGRRGGTNGASGESPAVRAQRDSPRDPVPVLTAVDSSGGVFQAILASLTEIEAALDGRIDAGSVLCSDGSGAYVHLAERAGAEHRAVFVRASITNGAQVNADAARDLTPGRLGLRRVNMHHERLHHLITERCRGVATKYLGHYLGWNRAMLRPGFRGKMLLDRALR